MLIIYRAIDIVNRNMYICDSLDSNLRSIAMWIVYIDFQIFGWLELAPTHSKVCSPRSCTVTTEPTSDILNSNYSYEQVHQLP